MHPGIPLEIQEAVTFLTSGSFGRTHTYACSRGSKLQVGMLISVIYSKSRKLQRLGALFDILLFEHAELISDPYSITHHGQGSMILVNKLAAQVTQLHWLPRETCVFANLQQCVEEDILKNNRGYDFAIPCTSQRIGTIRIP